MNNFMDKIDKKYVKLLGFLIILVFFLILTLNLLYLVRGRVARNSIINSTIDGKNWPIEDVPILVKDGINISGDLKNMYNVNCENEVTYDELRSYLIQLYNAGFEPVKEFGCQNPNNLKTSIEGVKLKEILWIGEKDNYTVNILWAQRGAKNEYDEEYNYNFEMTLFVTSDSYYFIDDSGDSSGDNEIIQDVNDTQTASGNNG